jgi:hypothetical protein
MPSKPSPDLGQQFALLPDPPRYWRDETGGKLGPAVERYLKGKPLSGDDLRWLRAYCAQWINSSAWDLNPYGDGKELAALRESAKEIRSIQQLDRWFRDAFEIGMDPL